MATPRIINEPECEGIFRYYTCAHAPWEYFQHDTNPDAPPSVLVDHDDEWAVTVGPDTHTSGADITATGRRLLSVYGIEDAWAAHPLDGTLYDSDDDALHAAYDAGLKAFRVPV